jgi:membrane-bound metal-dependent hydrolase YbcI (DUF457 family)
LFLLSHLGFTAAPGALVATWWGENRGFANKAPDMRWLLAGAVLPDLIDKPIGQVLLKSSFENGRIFGHTFILALALFIAGTYQWKRRGDSRVLLLAFGVASHLILDRVWAEPTTALWPSMGPFLHHPSMQTITEQILEYVRDPVFWVSELSGAAFLVFSLRYLGVRTLRDLHSFVVSGRSPSLAQFEAGYSSMRRQA